MNRALEARRPTHGICGRF